MGTDYSLTNIAIFEKHLSDYALCSIVQDRNDQDRYNIKVTPLSMVNSDSVCVSEKEALSFITVRSKWSHLVGWSSYFGQVFPHNSKKLLIIGIETALPHETRGAYLIHKSYIYEFPPSRELISALRHLAQELCPIYDTAPSEKKWGVIRAKSVSPEEHTQIERYILEHLASAYEHNTIAAFRTLVFTNSQLSQENDHILVATTPNTKKIISNERLNNLENEQNLRTKSIIHKGVKGLEKGVKGFGRLFK